MTTGTLGSTARHYAQAQPIFFRKELLYSQGNGVQVIGIAPAGMIIDTNASAVYVKTAFNGTTPVLDIGTSADPDLFGTDVTLAAQGRVALFDEAASVFAANIWPLAADTTLVAQMALTAASAGAGYIVIVGYHDVDG